jgi:single-strand DNA-binding protein
VYIVGKIKTRSYVDKDGNNKYITEILADALLLLDKKQGIGTSAPQTESSRVNSPEKEVPGPEINEPPTPYQPTNEDDLPF